MADEVSVDIEDVSLETTGESNLFGNAIGYFKGGSAVTYTIFLIFVLALIIIITVIIIKIKNKKTPSQEEWA